MKRYAIIALAILTGEVAAESSGWLTAQRVDVRGDEVHIRLSSDFSTCEHKTWGLVSSEWLSERAVDRILSVALAAEVSERGTNLLFDGCASGKAKVTGIALSDQS